MRTELLLIERLDTDIFDFDYVQNFKVLGPILPLAIFLITLILGVFTSGQENESKVLISQFKRSH